MCSVLPTAPTTQTRVPPSSSSSSSTPSTQGALASFDGGHGVRSMCSVLPTAPTTRTRVPPFLDTFLCGSVVEPPFLEQGQSMGRPWCSDAHPAECLNFRQGEQVSLTPPPIRLQQSATYDSAQCMETITGNGMSAEDRF